MLFNLWFGMNQYMNLDLQGLVDLLVIHTREYNRIISSGMIGVEEFTQCKQKLAEIHEAIKEIRKIEGDPMEYISPNFPENFPKYRINNRKE